MLKRFLVPEKDQVMVSEADARAATEAIFVKMGLPEDDAVLATDVLITSDLRGCESMGSNMLRNYVVVCAIDEPKPRLENRTQSFVSATIDGDQGVAFRLARRRCRSPSIKRNRPVWAQSVLETVATLACWHSIH